MTPEQLETIVQRHIPNPGKRTYPGLSDYRAAITDYLRLAARQPISDPEPMSRDWIRDGLNLNEIQVRSGLSSSDFSSVMESSLTGIIGEQFADAAQDIQRISRPYTMINYRPKRLSLFELGAPELMPEDEEYPKLPVKIVESTAPAKVESYGMQISFSRAIFETLGAEILQSLSDYAASFSTLETDLITQLLENSTLPTSASSGLDATGLAKCTAALRLQSNSAGRVANYSLANLISPPPLEMAAYALKQSTGMDFGVVVLPGLSSASTWFGIASSERSPILRLNLQGGGKPRVYRNKKLGDIEGAQFAISLDVGFSLAGDGLGAVKCTA